MPFRAIQSRTVRWRPLEGIGLEHLTIGAAAGAIVARSVAIGERDGTHYGISYTLTCEADWSVREIAIKATTGHCLHLTSNGQGKWMDSAGAHLPAFDGCFDVDVSGTPFTNTLPIRRLGLEPGRGAVEIPMLFIPCDTLVPVRNIQRYDCLQPDQLYRFETEDRSFTADLPVVEDGLVLDYPQLFQRVM
jgi:uncharacterized protein